LNFFPPGRTSPFVEPTQAYSLKLQKQHNEAVKVLLNAPSEKEAAEEGRNLQKKGQECLNEYEREASKVYRTYLRKIEKMTLEWSEFFSHPHRSHSPASQAALTALHHLRRHFVVFLMEDLRPHIIPETLQLSLSQLEVTSFCEENRVGIVVEALFALIKDGHLAYPFKKFIMGDIQAMFQRLRSYRPIIETSPYTPQNIKFFSGLFGFEYLGQPTLLISEQQDYEEMDVIGDYFQEIQRLKARRQDQKLSAWESFYDWETMAPIFKEMLEKKNALNTSSLRETLFRRVKECTQFKPSLVVAIIRLLGGTRMLDFSAGWGDRLIGALAAGLDRYLAFDPNLDLKPGHEAIVSTFASKEASSRYTVIYEPFQTASLPEGETFDLIFTSPPFFNFEIYTQREGQSVLDFPSFEKWTVGFLFTSLRKSWTRLEVDGHMAIHITDVYKTKICEVMNLYIQMSLPGAEYQGVISSSGKVKKPRPIWVWKRKSESDPERQKKATEALRSHFSSIYQLLFSFKRKREDNE